MRTGWPMSSMKISPPSARAADCRTSWTASGIDMKNRVIRSSVMVTGPPARIWRMKVGMTLPLLPRTLPNRTAQ